MGMDKDEENACFDSLFIYHYTNHCLKQNALASHALYSGLPTRPWKMPYTPVARGIYFRFGSSKIKILANRKGMKNSYHTYICPCTFDVNVYSDV